jgi:phosphoribosyl 1,2-cyclic phosphate phosphodiesterase
MERKFTFLGTGSSLGVPVIGCKCAVCLSSNPKNQRMRSAGLLTLKEKNFLIDAGPDLRMQVLTHKIDRLEGFILTHFHYDHVAGFDDLKAYHYLEGNKKLPCMMLEETWEHFKNNYSYLLSDFSWNLLECPSGQVLFQGLKLEYFSYYQGKTKVLGLRVDNLAYVTDIKEYGDDLLQKLQGIEILIVGAVRPQKSSRNFSLEDALGFAEKIGPKKTYLTHMAHEIDYDLIQGNLPSDVHLAYDGLSFSF